jgi:rhodanese-related sulfurtransferase
VQTDFVAILMPAYTTIAISQAFNAFDELLDVRSPAEYADDHLPAAISVPVLNDDERARVGTLFKQVSPFAAKKQGAALIARNIAHHVETVFSDRPKSWRPLVYCWRGGMRSGAMAHIGCARRAGAGSGTAGAASRLTAGQIARPATTLTKDF